MRQLGLVRRTRADVQPSCDEVRRLFSDMVSETTLPSAARESARQHLRNCEECTVAFAAVVDRAFAEGVLVRPSVVPALQFPTWPSVRDSAHRQGSTAGEEAAALALGVRSDLKAWNWRYLRELARKTSETARDVPEATLRALVALIDRGASDVSAATTTVEDSSSRVEQLQRAATARVRELRGLFESALSTWAAHQLAEQTAGGRTPTVSIPKLDANQAATGDVSVAAIEEGPVVTADGDFRLVVRGDSTWSRGRLLCVVDVGKGEAVRFDAETSRGDRRVGWRVELTADGLPRMGGRDITIPAAHVRLFLLPSDRS